MIPKTIGRRVIDHTVQVLDDAPKGVAMSSDENALPFLDLRNDGVVPEWERALDGQFQGFKQREFLFGRSVGVARILHDDLVVLARFFQRRRRHVEATAPNLNLESRN